VNRSHLYPSAKIQIDPIGACATILVERYQHEKIIPSKQTATMLYAGIVSNTINLRNKVTTKRDIQAASFLKKIAEIPDDFVKKMFTAKSDLNGVNLRNLIEIDYYERSFFDKIFSMSQIEAVGINSLVKDRVEEIREIIKSLTSKNGPDYQFINLIDILDGYNIIIAFSKETENLLTKVLNIKFEDGLAKTDYIIMRKEIIAKLKDYFDSKK
jgi:inorganic pyrophosphatase/exopolyphosphatase